MRQQRKLKAWHIVLLLVLVAGTILIARQNHGGGSASWQQEEGLVFGTVYHTTYECDSSLNEVIMEALMNVDASLSMFNPKSTISKINRGESRETDPLFLQVFRISQEISKATDGDFDITVAPLVNAWGFGFKGGELPDSAAVDSLLAFVGWQKVSIDEEGLVEKADERMVLDCSAVAKGFGVDQAALVLRCLGVENYMVEIGGEVAVSGTNPKGKPWSIGINRPVEDSTSQNREIEAVVELTNCRMATSGNYRNYYTTADGRKLAHTIDPHTGYPVQHNILSSTVIAPSCAMADAFATAFMVMGLDKAKETLAAHPQLKAYLIYLDEEGREQTWKTDNLEIKKETRD